MGDEPIEATSATVPELDIRLEKQPDLWRVTVTYGDAQMTLASSSEAGAGQLETLVQGLPQIMHHVYIDMKEKGAA